MRSASQIDIKSIIILIANIEKCGQKILTEPNFATALNDIKKYLSVLRNKLRNNPEAILSLKRAISWIESLSRLAKQSGTLLFFPLEEKCIPPNLYLYGLLMSELIKKRGLYFSDMLALNIQNFLNMAQFPEKKLRFTQQGIAQKNKKHFENLAISIQKFLRIADAKMITCIQNNQALHGEIFSFFELCFEKVKNRRSELKRHVEVIKWKVEHILKSSADMSNLNLQPIASPDSSLSPSSEQVLFAIQFLATQILVIFSFITRKEEEHFFYPSIPISSVKQISESSPHYPVHQKLLKIRKDMAPYLTKGILQIWNIETHVILEKKAPVQVAVMGSGFPFKAGEEPKCMKNLQRKVKKATDVDVLFDKKKLKDGRVRWCPLIILEDYHYDSTATSSPGTSFEDTASARFIGKSIPAAPALSAIKDKDRSEPSSRAEP